MAEPVKFTQAEAAGLWQAVQWMDLCLKQSVGATDSQLAFERDRLVSAKKALRKVQAMRRAEKAKKKEPSNG